MANEVRFAVGSPEGLRSTVWKVVVQGDDVYIVSRMMGADGKTSLHASGQWQHGGTSEWLQRIREKGVEVESRHLVRWQGPEVQAGKASHAYRIIKPRSEMRMTLPEKKLSKVSWLQLPDDGHQLIAEVFITPVSVEPPTGWTEPYTHLASLPMRMGRWVVVLYQYAEIPEVYKRLLSEVKQTILRAASDQGYEPSPEHRLTLSIVDEAGVHGLVEACAL